MKALKKTAIFFAATMVAVLIINSCGNKGNGITPTPPNPCASKTITVSGAIVNTAVGQSTGSITATAAGSNNFTYQLNSAAFQASNVFNGLASGAYTITAKDADGCIGSASFTVTDPCMAKSITITTSVVNAGPANGATNGSITALGGGSSGFTYQLNTGAFQSSGTFSALAPGTYNIIAKDADGCTKTQSAVINFDACVGKSITINGVATASDLCSPTGSITITATGSTGFTYQLGTGAYQSSNVFTNVAANTYTVAAKDGDGCIKTTTVTVTQLAAGLNYSDVKSVLQNSCALSGCHSGAAPAGGLNFTQDCIVVSSWDRIKARAVDALPTVMPPLPNTPLSTSAKQKITDWIAAGHRYTD